MSKKTAIEVNLDDSFLVTESSGVDSYLEKRYGYIDNSLEKVLPFVELFCGEDKRVIENSVIMQLPKNEVKVLKDHLKAADIECFWLVNALCISAPILCLSPTGVISFVNSGFSLGGLELGLGRSDNRSNGLIIASRRVFKVKSNYYFLLLPSTYVLFRGYQENREDLFNLSSGWSFASKLISLENRVDSEIASLLEKGAFVVVPN